MNLSGDPDKGKKETRQNHGKRLYITYYLGAIATKRAVKLKPYDRNKETHM